MKVGGKDYERALIYRGTDDLEYDGPFKWSLSILDYERWRAKGLGHRDVMEEIEDAMTVLEQEANERLDHPDEYLDSADD